MRIVITGSASHLARCVIPLLLARPETERIVGIDLRPADCADPRFEQHLIDIRSDAVPPLLARADVLIHLAFVVMRSDLGAARHDRALMRSINVDGSTRLFAQAAAARIRSIIYASSASVYRPGGPVVKLSEEAPRIPLPGFPYAEDKAAVEQWLDGFEPHHPELRIVRLRPQAILGPHAQPLLKLIARSRVYPLLPDPQPMIQCVHEQDVAAAVVRAAATAARGAFNLSTDDAASIRDIVRAHGLALGIPMRAVETLARWSWRMTSTGTDPSWVSALRHSFVLDNAKAREVLRWTPRYPRLDECLATVRERAS